MALSTLRGRGEGEGGHEASLEIGMSDARIVNCPVCSRPIVSDARRCPGCRTRLVMSVPARKAGAFVATGLLVGALAGAAVVGSAVALQSSDVASPVSAAATAGAIPAASIVPAPVVPAPVGQAAPATSLAALRQAVAINGRLALGVDPLQASLAARPFETTSVAAVLRSLAADAAVGSDAAARLRPWGDAAAAQASLAALYEQVRATARSGLAAGLANQGAYREAAREMLLVLATVGGVDEAARALASSVGIDLPPGGAG